MLAWHEWQDLRNSTGSNKPSPRPEKNALGCTLELAACLTRLEGGGRREKGGQALAMGAKARGKWTKTDQNGTKMALTRLRRGTVPASAPLLAVSLTEELLSGWGMLSSSQPAVSAIALDAEKHWSEKLCSPAELPSVATGRPCQPGTIGWAERLGDNRANDIASFAAV